MPQRRPLRETISRWLIPESLNTDSQTRRRAITTVLFGHSMSVWAAVFVLIYYHLDGPQAATTLVFACLGCTFNILSLKLHGSLLLTSNLLAAIVLGTLLALSVSTGGMIAPAMIWLPAVPIIAILLCGSRAGLAWLLTTLVLGAVICLLDMSGSMPPSELQQDNGAWAYFLGLLGIITCTTLLCFVFDFNARALRRELEESRIAAEQANSAKSEFLAHMSHEIRTPMNGVMGMLELLSNTSVSPRQEEYVSLASQSAEALLRVLNDILDFSKIEAGRLDLESIPFEVRDVVGDTLQSLEPRATEKGLELACHIPPDIPDVLSGDPGRLRQIIINLVGNAIKFTQHGEIVVGISVRELTDDHARLRYSIRDSGVGIPKHKQQRIFEAFGQADNSTTREFGGTGLGLNISSQLIGMMGGQLALNSEEGRGTEFYFEVNFGTSGSSTVRATLPDALRGLHVLVVDDNATSRFILEEVLSEWQMQVTTADNARGALEILGKTHSTDAPIQLVLLDMMMPETDGLNLAEQIQSDVRCREIPLMLLSTSSAQQHNDRCAAAGIVAQLRKPVKQTELLNQIRCCFGTENADRPLPNPVVTVDRSRPVRILLAEDGLVNQKVAMGLLALHGHSVTLAETGRQAVAAWENGDFELILMDFEMPEMDGVAATAAIRESECGTGRHIPIVAMTAHAIKGDRERFLSAGMDAHVAKPVDPAKLYEVIDQLTQTESTHEVSVHASPDQHALHLNTTAASVVDWEAALDSTAGDKELLGGVVQTALQEMPVIKSQLQDLLREEQLETTARVAHTMKSVASMFFAAKARDAASVVEESASNNDLDSAIRDMPCLLEAIDELISLCDEYVASA